MTVSPFIVTTLVCLVAIYRDIGIGVYVHACVCVCQENWLDINYFIC